MRFVFVLLSWGAAAEYWSELISPQSFIIFYEKEKEKHVMKLTQKSAPEYEPFAFMGILQKAKRKDSTNATFK